MRVERWNAPERAVGGLYEFRVYFEMKGSWGGEAQKITCYVFFWVVSWSDRKEALPLVETIYKIAGAPRIALLADLHGRPYDHILFSLRFARSSSEIPL